MGDGVWDLGSDLGAPLHSDLHFLGQLVLWTQGLLVKMLSIRCVGTEVCRDLLCVCPAIKKHRAGTTVRVLALASNLLHPQH